MVTAHIISTFTVATPLRNGGVVILKRNIHPLKYNKN